MAEKFETFKALSPNIKQPIKDHKTLAKYKQMILAYYLKNPPDSLILDLLLDAYNDKHPDKRRNNLESPEEQIMLMNELMTITATEYHSKPLKPFQLVKLSLGKDKDDLGAIFSIQNNQITDELDTHGNNWPCYMLSSLIVFELFHCGHTDDCAYGYIIGNGAKWQGL